MMGSDAVVDRAGEDGGRCSGSMGSGQGTRGALATTEEEGN